MISYNIEDKDIPKEIFWLCEIVGLKAFMEVVDRAGGEIIYIPKRQTIEQPLRKKAILKDYNGSNVRELSRKYGLSTRRIFAILEEMKH